MRILLKNYLITLTLLFLLLQGCGNSETLVLEKTYEVGKEPMIVELVVTGELKAKNAVRILGPLGIRSAGLSQVKIAAMVPEGTTVQRGDFVATLDRTELSNKLKELYNELEKKESQYQQAKLDTAIEMRRLRDNLTNLKFTIEEKKLTYESSKFESPAIIRQAEIDLNNTKRSYAQELNAYELKLKQNKAKMLEIYSSLKTQQSKFDAIKDLLEEFTINAPEPGMVIYQKDWSGNKIKEGSNISIWNPTIAELPDLSKMISQCNINEIDISKVKKNQKVEIKIDAFPDKKYTGKIISIANIGQELPNTRVKVFEVEIEVLETDSLLLPSMTTQNTIKVFQSDSVLQVPQACVLYNDTFQYVLMKKDKQVIKKEIRTGVYNSTKVQIIEGVKKGDKIYYPKIDENLNYPTVRLPNTTNSEASSKTSIN
jgi:multidrug efflux pump subunit AcrA (membrane-fusion protein)